MQNTSCEISVIMATYHPVWEKCVFTLDSIVGQKNVDFELIIVDDGSKENLFDRFESYFSEKGFTDYHLIAHEKNQGTVLNVRDGVNFARGKYLKLISPGDALFNETTLNDWCVFLKKSGRKWSFSDAVFVDTNEIKIISSAAFPRLIDCYYSDNSELCRWNYVVLEDVALGAALLCETSLFAEYLERFVGKVKYAEDVSYVAMMFDGILPAYYKKNAVFYEFGLGVSTGEKVWKERIQDDVRVSQNIIASADSMDPFQKRMAKALTTINSGGYKKKRIMKNLQKGGIKKVLKFRLNPRLTSVDFSNSGPWWNDFQERKNSSVS